MANLNPGLALRVIPCSPSPTVSEKKYSKHFIDFLGRCLELDPARRWTAEKLLGHSLFKKIKREKLKKLVKDSPTEGSGSATALHQPSFNGLDGNTPHWETAWELVSLHGVFRSTLQQKQNKHKPTQ